MTISVTRLSGYIAKIPVHSDARAMRHHYRAVARRLRAGQVFWSIHGDSAFSYEEASHITRAAFDRLLTDVRAGGDHILLGGLRAGKTVATARAQAIAP